jgi:hypothetical protein
MLAGLCPVYVGRFARIWLRLSTTDPYTIDAIISLSGNERKCFFTCTVIFVIFKPIRRILADEFLSFPIKYGFGVVSGSVRRQPPDDALWMCRRFYYGRQENHAVFQKK